MTDEIKSETITTRQGKDSQTFNKDDVYCVPQALGHNRLDVTIMLEELSDKLGVSRQAVSKCESKQSSPDLEKLVLLSK